MHPLQQYIREVPDFPIKGVAFKDIFPLLHEHFSETVDGMRALFTEKEWRGIDKIVGLDARGFIFAGALAHSLGKGFVPIRKKGKLPPDVLCAISTNEYATEALEMYPGEGVALIVDDVLATGGTLSTAADLCEDSGYTVFGFATLVNLSYLNNFEWNGMKARSVITY